MGMKSRTSAEVTIYHNPNCSTSKHALTVAEGMNVAYREVRYLKDKPDRATLEHLVTIIADPVEDLIRKDSRFKKLGLNASDYVGKPEAVVDLLSEHIALLQRPILVRGERAIIGRPKSRVDEFLA